MERIKTIVGSGVRKINLVAPMVRLSAPLRQEILKSPFKGLSLSEGTLMRSGEGWCDIVAFSGLADVVSPTVYELPDGIFPARRGFERGFMDYTGAWVYSESVFSSLSDDDGHYYW